MADQELFDGQIISSIPDDHNIAVQQPNPVNAGSKVISWANFKNLLNTLYVSLGNIAQSIDGVKTFLKSPIVPDPTTDLQAVNLRTLNSKTTNPVKIQFDTTQSPTITEEGSLWWNGEEHTMNIDTGLGATIQVGQEQLMLYYNDTGVTITNGSVLHLKSAALFNGVLVKTPELADASTWEKCQGTLSVATHDIPDGALGIATLFGDVRDVDTSGVGAGAQLWLSATNPGEFTDVKPIFPDLAISLGGSYNSQVEGKIFVNFTSSIEDVFHDSWDGSIIETFNFTTSSNGTTVTGLLENVDNTRNLTLRLSTGFYTLDTTTTTLTIALTAGTDASPVTNYVYIPLSTKVLTISTSAWPTSEHVKIALLEVGLPATIQSEGGCIRNQNINDHLKKEDDNGHILHIAERIRQLNAEHDNGTEATLTGTTANGYINITGGQVWQLHKQTFPALSMATGNYLRIVNDFTTAYRRTLNLNTIDAYSSGSTWNNEWGKIVIWGVANKTGEPSFMMCNLPSAGYNSEANAKADASAYADYSIPKRYKGVGFLIAAFTIRITSGTITYNASTGYEDLRGFVPNNVAGGGGGGAGVTSFLGLTDTPSTYSGQAGKVVAINTSETALEFIDVSASVEYALNTATTWDGTNYSPDMATSDVDQRTVNNSVTSLIFATPSNISTTKRHNKWIVIDNSGNSSAIATITFTGYTFPVGVEPTGLAAGAIAVLELDNTLGSVVRSNWTVDE